MIRPCQRWLIITFALVAFSSCEGDYDIKFKWTGLNASNADNTGEKPVVSTADSIPANAYVIRCDLFPEEISRKGRYLDSETPPQNVNGIKSITVTSNNSFGAAYPADTSLNNLFLIFNDSYLNTSTLDEHYITNVFSDEFYDKPIPDHADLLLMVPPEASGYHTFTVKIVLEDGTTFIDSTDPVKLY